MKYLQFGDNNLYLYNTIPILQDPWNAASVTVENDIQVMFKSHTKKQTSQCFWRNQMQTSTLNKDSENFNV